MSTICMDTYMETLSELVNCSVDNVLLKFGPKMYYACTSLGWHPFLTHGVYSNTRKNEYNSANKSIISTNKWQVTVEVMTSGLPFQTKEFVPVSCAFNSSRTAINTALAYN